MVTYPSTYGWTPIRLPVLRTIQLTTDAQELSRANWPGWAAESTQFNRIFVYSRNANAVNNLLPISLSFGILAALMTERIDTKDAPDIFNYNIYLIAETTDERFFQSPPIRPTDPAHHSTSPSTWFDGLVSPL